jgi:hypothetical protein
MFRSVIIGGGIAGILAGSVMAAAAMIYSAANGSGFFLPVRNIAATWYGASALVGGAGVLIVGLLTHLGTSALWGGIFAALSPRRKSVPVALVEGLFWGVVVWAVTSFAVMSWINPTMYAGTVEKDGVWWFILHLIYGAALVVTLGFVRRIAAGWPLPEPKRYPEPRRAA